MVSARIVQRAILMLPALSVVAASLLVMTAWTRVVPIFEAPDEQDHFDYAIAIAHAHRLIRSTEGVLTHVADPVTVYLAQKVDLNRIAFHGAERVEPDYGEARYFAELNAGAPHVEKAFYAAPNHPFPWLVTGYSFGFYSLIAAVIVAAQKTGGVVGAFFAARSACSIIVATGLLFCYLSLRELRFGVARATSATAIMGLLPLTVFIGSYVQPDDLSFCLACAIFYAILRLKRAPESSVAVAAVGLLMGLLAVTKIHIYAALLLPIVGFAATTMLRLPPNRRRWGRLAFWLAVPALLTMTVQYGWVHPVGGVNKVTFGDMHADAYRNALSTGGLGAAVALALHWLWLAVHDFYGNDGTTLVSFWGDFGWLDTPVEIYNTGTEQIVRNIISALTWFTIAAMLVVIARHVSACLMIAKRGRLMSGIRLLLADPLTGAYIVLTMMMFVLYTFSQNGFGAQGRNWFPLLLPIMLVAMDRAPRVFLNPRAVVWVQRSMTFLLACYAGVGTYYSSKDVLARYYNGIDTAPSLRTFASTPDGLQAQGHIDFVGNEDGSTYISSKKTIAVYGWAVDSVRKSVARDVVLVVDGGQTFLGKYHMERDDVARLVSPNYEYAGFVAGIPPGTLPPGRHRLTLRVVPRDATFYESFPTTRAFDVTNH